MPSADKGKSLHSLRPIVKLLTHPSQLSNLLREFGRGALATRANAKQVSPNDVTLPADPKPQPRPPPNLDTPSTLSPLKACAPRNSSPAQVLCSARSALLKDKYKLSVNHPLRRHVNKKNGALELLQHAPAPRRDHAFPPTPPKRCLRGLSRGKQRDRVSVHHRMIVRSEAQDKLRETQIQIVEFRRWESRDPRLLAGLGNIYMGPSADASVELVELWVKAKAHLKQRCRYDGAIVSFFEEQNFILVNPETGLPLYWSRQSSKRGRLWFLNSKTERKQWDVPRGTDLHKFEEFLRAL